MRSSRRGRLIGSTCTVLFRLMQPLGGARSAIDLFNDWIASSRFMRLLTAQPNTCRECRSRITEGYSQPSRVQSLLMSPVHFWFGFSAAKSRSYRFGAVLSLWPLTVVTFAHCPRTNGGNVLTVCGFWQRIFHIGASIARRQMQGILPKGAANTAASHIQADLFQLF